MFKKLLAQGQLGTIENPFATIGGPAALSQSQYGSGLFSILNVFFRTAIVLGGVYTVLNLILAGYGYLSAGGDPKAVTRAWDKIWQSLIGLLVIAGSTVLAIIFGSLIFGADNALILINPRVYTP